MQTATAYRLPLHAPLAARGVGFLDYVRAGTFPIWMFSLQFPFWFVRDWTFWQEGNEFRTYYYAGFGVCLAVHLVLSFNSWIRAPFEIATSWSGAFVTAFCAIAFVLSPISLKTSTTALYAISTWGVFVLLHVFWQTDYRATQRAVVLSGLIIFAWQVLLVLHLGVHVGLSIGGILRNYTGQAALAAMACCMLSGKKYIQWSAIGAAIFFCLLINSRGSLLAIFAFLAAFYGLKLGTSRAIVLGILGTIVAACAVLIVPKIQDLVLNDILHLHDEVRGTESGFTGRVNLNKAGAGFWKKPIFGYGFRVSSQAGVEFQAIHSGYLKVLVETGFVGAFLIVGAVVIEAGRRFFVVQRIRDLPPTALPNINLPDTIRLNAMAFATMCMTLTLWLYEPLYVNLGSVTSLLFWLMIVSPTYVTAQGLPLRKLS